MAKERWKATPTKRNSRVRYYRRCPNCGTVLPAGKFEPVNKYHGHHYHKVRGQGSLRRCPKCRFVGFTQQFRVMRPE